MDTHHALNRRISRSIIVATLICFISMGAATNAHATEAADEIAAPKAPSMTMRVGKKSKSFSKQQRKRLRKIANYLINNPQLGSFIIVGHTDNRGKSKVNKKLSLKRAKSVKRVLVKFGVSAKRLSVEGRGSSEPKFKNKTKKGRRRNQRVELIPNISSPPETVAVVAEPQPPFDKSLEDASAPSEEVEPPSVAVSDTTAVQETTPASADTTESSGQAANTPTVLSTSSTHASRDEIAPQKEPSASESQHSEDNAANRSTLSTADEELSTPTPATSKTPSPTSNTEPKREPQKKTTATKTGILSKPSASKTTKLKAVDVPIDDHGPSTVTKDLSPLRGPQNTSPTPTLVQDAAPSKWNIPLWSSVGAAAATASAAVLFTISANAQFDSANAAGRGTDAYTQAYDAWKQQAIVANVMYGLSAASAAAALWFYFDTPSETASGALSVAPLLSSDLVYVQLTFELGAPSR